MAEFIGDEYRHGGNHLRGKRGGQLSVTVRMLIEKEGNNVLTLHVCLISSAI